MTKTGEKSLFCYFLVTFSLLSGRPPKSLFRYFLVTLKFLGFRALWDLLPLTSLATHLSKTLAENFACPRLYPCKTQSSHQTSLRVPTLFLRACFLHKDGLKHEVWSAPAPMVLWNGGVYRLTSCGASRAAMQKLSLLQQVREWMRETQREREWLAEIER